MKNLIGALILTVLLITPSWGSTQPWESKGDLYFLTKDTRENFSAVGAGPNKFSSKYLTYDGIDFLVKGSGVWRDYGRLNLGNNNIFRVPVRSGMKINEIHLLASGNYGNSYKSDLLLRMYGENYYYAVVNLIFVYQDGTYKNLSAPVFWDWFHLPSVGWTKNGVISKVVGNNPVRQDCTMYHLKFTNPKPNQPIKDVLISDSWLSDQPFSDVFALTVRSSDAMPARPKSL